MTEENFKNAAVLSLQFRIPTFAVMPEADYEITI
jgi:hypothetical protein